MKPKAKKSESKRMKMEKMDKKHSDAKQDKKMVKKMVKKSCMK